jgi:hypothetical protein
MTYKRRISQHLEGSKQKHRKSDDDNSEIGGSSTGGIITLIHDFVNKR